MLALLMTEGHIMRGVPESGDLTNVKVKSDVMRNHLHPPNVVDIRVRNVLNRIRTAGANPI